jgi:hypothetical protein
MEAAWKEEPVASTTEPTYKHLPITLSRQVWPHFFKDRRSASGPLRHPLDPLFAGDGERVALGQGDNGNSHNALFITGLAIATAKASSSETAFA